MLLRKPIASIILVLAVLIFGGVTLSRLSIELLPDITEPTLLVSTEYVGAPALDVEYRINEPLERVLGSVRGIREVKGMARQGQSLIFLTFNWGMDMDLAFLNVREKLDQARYFLPNQAGRPQLIYSSASDEPIATLALTLRNDSGQKFEDRLELKRWAEQVFSRRLEQQEGIAQALLVGAVEPEVQIQFNPKQLDRYGLTFAHVERVIQEANLFSASGELRDGLYRYALKIQSRIRSLDDIKNIPVTSLANGRVLLLSELAEIKVSEADPTSFALLDNREVITVLVKKEYGANTVTVFETLKAVLGEVRNQHQDIEIEILNEDASYIENSVVNLLQTLLIGGILAFIVLFLFLDDARSPFTIGVSIPVSIFLTFTVMYLFDIQLNIISLSGLTLGIGLLLDNSIVVLENINRYKKMGFERFEAAAKGTKEIALAVSASTFTTISVFLPLIFLGGFEGAFFRDLAATLSISLISSLLIALVILPVFVAHFSSSESTGLLLRVSAGLENLIAKYETSLIACAKKPVPVLLTAVFLLVAAGWIFLIVPKSALPESEPTQIDYLITMPGNTALRSAKEASNSIATFLKEEAGASNILSIGGYTDNISLNAIQNEGVNKFILSVPIANEAEKQAVYSVIEGIKSIFKEWTFSPIQSAGFGNLASVSEQPIQFSIVGTDRDLSKRVGETLETYLQTTFPELELNEKFPQTVDVYRLTFKADALMLYEISEQEVISYLESLTRGKWVTDWNRQDEQVSIRLIGGETKVTNPNDIALTIKDKIIPLHYLAEIEIEQEAEQIERSAQTAVLTVTSNLDFTDWWWKSAEIRSQIAYFMQQTGYEVRIGGSALQLIALLQELGTLLLISVLLIYLILAIQYENLLYPLLIILAIPFAWVGSVMALYMFDVSLNALSFMGILVLTGIAVNDSILKVDFMRRYFDETGDVDEAIRQAGINRFRPVVMTSITTILGLIPMLIPFGDGFILRQSLAVALIGGMLTSTLLTLYLIPLVFRLITKRTNVSEITYR